MPAFTVILTGIVRRNGKIYVTFADKTQYEAPSVAELRRWAVEHPVKGLAGTHQKCVEYALARDDSLIDVSAVLNQRFTYDPAHDNPIRVRPR